MNLSDAQLDLDFSNPLTVVFRFDLIEQSVRCWIDGRNALEYPSCFNFSGTYPSHTPSSVDFEVGSAGTTHHIPQNSTVSHLGICPDALSDADLQRLSILLRNPILIAHIGAGNDEVDQKHLPYDITRTET